MSDAQAFTLEGAVAALLLIIATFMIFQSSVISAPSWGELYNVQMRVLAFDILRTLDKEGNIESMIANISVSNCNQNLCDISATSPEFVDKLNSLLDEISAYGRLEIVWVDTDGKLRNLTLKPFNLATKPDAVRASRYVLMDTKVFEADSPFYNLTERKLQVFEVRLEVWR